MNLIKIKQLTDEALNLLPINSYNTFDIDSSRENIRIIWVTDFKKRKLYGIKIFYSPEFNRIYFYAMISLLEVNHKIKDTNKNVLSGIKFIECSSIKEAVLKIKNNVIF